MYDVTDIKKYILFLKNGCGLQVTLHPSSKESRITLSELISFNIHESPYCVYIKSFPEAYRHCVERQKKIVKKCECGAFCGSCFAGVREWVYPISNGEENVGFICVSGYVSENAESFIKSVSEKYFIPAHNLHGLYKNLNERMPEKSELDTLIIPLCNMLELAYIRSAGELGGSQGTIDAVISYIKRHHTEQITLDDICARFLCSRSYISHIFKKSTGKSFREYLTEIRLDDAKMLLTYSSLSITEISFSVGFSDSGYFSSVFKKRFGVSPAAYRKREKAINQ